MQTKEAVAVLCNVCQEAMTTHTAETQTTSGKPVSFPCCLKCRSVIYDLEYEREEMLQEKKISEGVRERANKAIVKGVTVGLPSANRTRHLQTTKGREQYKFKPSAKSKAVTTKLLKSSDSTLGTLLLAMLKGK